MHRLGIAFALVAFSASMALAHPPSSIELKVSDEQLDINVVHPVANPLGHYIDDIVVLINGNKIITQQFYQQKGNNQIVAYIIPGMKKGDKISVSAECNKFGKKDQALVVQ